VQLVVTSDTHLLRPGGIPVPLRDAIEGADLLLHAGDVTSLAAWEELSALCRSLAVLGNNDAELASVLPEALEIEIEGVPVAVVHDSGNRIGRERRMAGRFPAARLVVFGHSHLPSFGAGDDGQLLLNPGSPTQRRQAPHPSFALVEIRDAEIVSAGIVEF
jgi:uncharacterized protein